MPIHSFILKVHLFVSMVKSAFKPSELKSLSSADVLLACSEGDRGYLFNSMEYSPLIDSVAELLIKGGYSVQQITKPLIRSTKKKTWSQAIGVDREFARIWFKGIISQRIREDERVALWSKVLEIVKPSLVIAIQPPPDLNVACKIAGVSIYDLQHGVIEPSVYYNNELKKFYGSSGVPDGCLCWDIYSKQSFEDAMSGLHGVVLGNPWIKRFSNPSVSDKLVVEENSKIKSTLLPRLGVTVTLQWENECPKNIAIPTTVIQVLKKLLDNNFSIWLRFHPVQIRTLGIKYLQRKWNEKTKLIIDGERVIDTSHIALPALLLRTAGHITGHSAAAIEASLLGVRSMLWRNDENIKRWFKEYLYKEDVFFLPNSIDDCLDWFTDRRTDLQANVTIKHDILIQTLFKLVRPLGSELNQYGIQKN